MISGHIIPHDVARQLDVILNEFQAVDVTIAESDLRGEPPWMLPYSGRVEPNSISAYIQGLGGKEKQPQSISQLH